MIPVATMAVDKTRFTDQLVPDSTAKGPGMYSFGTPNKNESAYETYISPITGKSVHYIKSPDDYEKTRGSAQMAKTESPIKNLYASYPKKSPNERLIDIKNATWKTKNTIHNQRRVNMDGKLLYNVGPRESYVVDKTFDGDLNFLALGALSHEGDLIAKRKPNREYVVEVDYSNELEKSKSRITHDMRRRLFEDMNEEHDVIVSSPHKYRRVAA